MNTYTPLGNRLSLEPIKADNMHGSLYIPVSAEDKETMNGRVIALSDDIETHSPRLKPGDIVRYDMYSGSDMPEGIKIIDLKDIIAIVHENK